MGFKELKGFIISRSLLMSFGPNLVSHIGFDRGKFNDGRNFSSSTRPNFRGITPDYRGHHTFSGSKFVPECQICNKNGTNGVIRPLTASIGMPILNLQFLQCLSTKSMASVDMVFWVAIIGRITHFKVKGKNDHRLYPIPLLP